MPRRKPVSAKQRKTELQLKRAVKRGDVEPEPKQTPKRVKRRRGPTGQLLHSAGEQGANREAAAQSVRKLQSDFVRLSPEYLERTKSLAASLALPRPLLPSVAVFPQHLVSDNSLVGATESPESGTSTAALACPRRPKWRFDQTKKEVEKNEEGLHRKWLSQTDAIAERWRQAPQSHSTIIENSSGEAANSDDQVAHDSTMPRSPTYYERNLEVWRQLWRVTEISQILLVLLDSRCPLLHFPPALETYLSAPTTASPSNKPRVILVLTKVDIAGPDRADAWSGFIRRRYPDARVVLVESYARRTDDVSPGNDEQKAGKHTHDPHLPSRFRSQLVDALREAHAELIQPPENVRGDPEKMKRWIPSTRKHVDWEEVLKAYGGKVGRAVGGAAAPRLSHVQEEKDQEGGGKERQEPEFLTIGLIGQPNVGKSSLLNALFGSIKVRASRTPGKTKHFQTLFWTPDVRLVDCPGLVVPNLVPMEMQVLSGILPISKVSAVPACIHFAAQFLPLERVFELTHPSASENEKLPNDKRTWREGMQSQTGPKDKVVIWTAMDILTAYATRKGWMTAKAGRPDINRAGNAILRALAEARVRWAFWPPDHDITQTGESDTAGIWIPGHEEDTDTSSETAARTDSESEDSDSGVEEASEGEEEDEQDIDEEVRQEGILKGGSLFNALSLANENGDDEDDASEVSY